MATFRDGQVFAQASMERYMAQNSQVLAAMMASQETFRIDLEGRLNAYSQHVQVPLTQAVNISAEAASRTEAMSDALANLQVELPELTTWHSKPTSRRRQLVWRPYNNRSLLPGIFRTPEQLWRRFDPRHLQPLRNDLPHSWRSFLPKMSKHQDLQLPVSSVLGQMLLVHLLALDLQSLIWPNPERKTIRSLPE
jgi:hypothetical protein